MLPDGTFAQDRGEAGTVRDLPALGFGFWILDFQCSAMEKKGYCYQKAQQISPV